MKFTLAALLFLFSTSIFSQETRFIEFLDDTGNKTQVSIVPINLEDPSDSSIDHYKAFIRGSGEESTQLFSLTPDQYKNDLAHEFAQKLGYSNEQIIKYEAPEMKLNEQEQELMKKAKRLNKFKDALYFYKKGGRALLTTVKFITYSGLTMTATSLALGNGINVFEPLFNPAATAEAIVLAKKAIMFGASMGVLGSIMTYMNQQFGKLVGSKHYEAAVKKKVLKFMGKKVDVSEKLPAQGAIYGTTKWGVVESLFVGAASILARQIGITSDATIAHILQEEAVNVGITMMTQGDFDIQSHKKKERALALLIKDEHSEIFDPLLQDARAMNSFMNGDYEPAMETLMKSQDSLTHNEALNLIDDNQSRLRLAHKMKNNPEAIEALYLYKSLQELIFDLKIMAASKLWSIANVLMKTGFFEAFLLAHGIIKTMAISQYDLSETLEKVKVTGRLLKGEKPAPKSCNQLLINFIDL